jgi:hypothetical protein
MRLHQLWLQKLQLQQPHRSTGTICHNFNTSEVACGQCYNSCAASTECVQGRCACTAGLTACTDTTGSTATYCVNTTSNPGHCGRCYNRCQRDQVCINGRCTCPNTMCQWGKKLDVVWIPTTMTATAAGAGIAAT